MKITIKNILEVIIRKAYISTGTNYTSFLLRLRGIRINELVCVGIPKIVLAKTAKLTFGSKLVIVSKAKYATLGKPNRSKISASDNATLKIGNLVAMSNTTIIATNCIMIGNNVMIGGGVTIVDTDFHSLNPAHWHTPDDEYNMKTAPVIIEDNVFIGMDSIILKGVKIGNNSIIGAGSVVSKDIPPNEIWAGNPAQFIKHVAK